MLSLLSIIFESVFITFPGEICKLIFNIAGWIYDKLRNIFRKR